MAIIKKGTFKGDISVEVESGCSNILLELPKCKCNSFGSDNWPYALEITEVDAEKGSRKGYYCCILCSAQRGKSWRRISLEPPFEMKTFYRPESKVTEEVKYKWDHEFCDADSDEFRNY